MSPVGHVIRDTSHNGVTDEFFFKKKRTTFWKIICPTILLLWMWRMIGSKYFVVAKHLPSFAPLNSIQTIQLRWPCPHVVAYGTARQSLLFDERRDVWAKCLRRKTRESDVFSSWNWKILAILPISFRLTEFQHICWM